MGTRGEEGVFTEKKRLPMGELPRWGEEASEVKGLQTEYLLWVRWNGGGKKVKTD